MSSYTTHFSHDHAVNPPLGMCCLPSSFVPPRIVRVCLSILGVAICIGGITIGAMGSSPIACFGLGGRIGIIFGSYCLGTLLTEIGKDPLHSQILAHNDRLSKIQNTIEIATRIPRIVLSIILDVILLVPYVAFLILHRCKSDSLEINGDNPSNNHLIVLIHGTNSNNGVWEFGKHHLKNNPFGRVMAINLEDRGSFLCTKANTIHTYAQRVIRELPNTPLNLVLIGHSMGGLVAAEVDRCLKGTTAKVHHIFTIATPWQGAPLLDALPACMKPARFIEMSEGSETLEGLNQDPSCEIDAYGSTTDPLVPEVYSLTQGCHNHRYPFGGHLGLVALSMVWRDISAKLDQLANHQTA